MDEKRFDNDVMCVDVYAYCKDLNGGREPYSPHVASVTVLVASILKKERARVEALALEKALEKHEADCESAREGAKTLD